MRSQKEKVQRENAAGGGGKTRRKKSTWLGKCGATRVLSKTTSHARQGGGGLSTDSGAAREGAQPLTLGRLPRRAAKGEAPFFE